MIRHRHQADDGLTGLEMVVLLALLISVTALLFMHPGGGDPAGSGRIFPGGLVADSMYVSGDNLQPVGNVYGFPSVSRTYGSPPVIVLDEDPDKLGVVRLVVSLFIGDTGAIDMDRVQVQWIRKSGRETLSGTTSAILVCPNWTVSDKYNLLPGRTADPDNWLEPGEQFEITVCPREGVPPYETFTLILNPDGSAMPLSVTRAVPFSIRPVMNLG